MQNNGNATEKSLSWRTGEITSNSSRDMGIFPKILDGHSHHPQHMTTMEAVNKKTAHSINTEDDLRISKLLRQLLEENNASVKYELCKKLEVAVNSPTNAQYICRTFQRLAENMLSIIRVGPNRCAELVATLLGIMCYITRGDFYKWYHLLFDEFDRCNSKLKQYIMLAFKTILSCDANGLELAPHSTELMASLKERLENATIGKDFMIVSDAIVHYYKCYSNEFEKHFTDIVDIIIGCHLEIDQLPAFKIHCSIVLQKFATLFLKRYNFTRGLIRQFLEDIAVCGENVIDDTVSIMDRQETEMRFGAFVGAFNTVIKALMNEISLMHFNFDTDLVSKSFAVITSTALQTFELKLSSAETVLNLNEFLFIVYNNCIQLMTMQNIQITEKLIELEIKHRHLFSNKEILSLLSLILCIIRKLGTALPRTMVHKINELSPLKLTRNKKVYKLLLRILHEVLLLKNVDLVQQAYLHITREMPVNVDYYTLYPRIAYEHLFDVGALSVLAMQTSSMITMHALDPSLFQALHSLYNLCQPQMYTEQPTLHAAIMHVYMLYCCRHRQFLDLSYVINERFISTQSGSNFTNNLAMLNFYFDKIQLQNDKQLLSTHMILDWAHSILKQCTQSASVLWDTSHFSSFCDRLCSTELVFVTKMPLKHAACIQVILSFEPTPPKALLQRIWYLTHTMLLYRHGKQHKKVQRIYSQILARLPLFITLTPQLNSIQLPHHNVEQLHEWYKVVGQNAALRSRYFKPLIDDIDVIRPFARKDEENSIATPVEQKYYEYFTRCWTLNSSSKKFSEYRALAQSNDQLLNAWVQHEAARYCVYNKLRTTIGKPQETFLAIEAIIMRYARLFTSNSTFQPTCEKRKIYGFWLDRVRLLIHTHQILGFLEELEKCIYNAAEGCAFALLATEKAAKTFFRINSHTCQEWFKRINPAISLIALNDMQPEMCIRYCENLLRSDKLENIHLEHTITALTWALLNCGESSALHGLYVWLHSKLGKRYIWIQHAAYQACGRRESAADGYIAVLNDLNNDNTSNSKLDAYLREFLIEQLSECLYSTAQWKKLRNLQSSWSFQPYRANHLKALDLICFDDDAIKDNLSTLLTLTEWDVVDSSSQQQQVQRNSNNASMLVLRQLEDVCMTKVLHHDDGKQATEQLRAVVQSAMLASLNHGTLDGRLNNIQTNCIILTHMMGTENWQNDVEEDADICKQMDSGPLLKCLVWSRLLTQNIRANESASHHNQYLNVASAARREGNLLLCNAMLNRFFILHGVDTSTSIAVQLQSDLYKLDISDAPLLRALAELTECMNASQHPVSAINLASAYCRQIIQQLPRVQMTSVAATSGATAISQMLLRLADWLQSQRNNSAVVSSIPQLKVLLSCLPVDSNINSTDAKHISTLEHSIGQLVHGSITYRVDIAEAWYVYGNLCYRWGKRVSETRASPNVDSTYVQNRHAIRNILHGDEQLRFFDMIENMMLLGKNDSIVNEDEEHADDVEGDDESPEAIDDNNSCERFKCELQKIEVLDAEQISAIIHIWRQVHGNVYYVTAMRSYFRYLAIAADGFSNTDGHSEKVKTTSQVTDCMFVTTTLRILRLIVKHALDLQDALVEVHNTPMRPWKAIIPQLFSRLNHNEPYVRKIVSELLCKLSEKYSNLVLYPAIIGAMQEQPPEAPDAATALECNLQQRKSSYSDSNASTNCNYTFNALLQSCIKLAHRNVVPELQILVREFKRITLLWDEYWLHSLAQLCSDYGPLFTRLEVLGKQNITSNASGNLKNHYAIIMDHLIADLQRIFSVTKHDPQSVYESNFQLRYNVLIETTISGLQNDYEIATSDFKAIKTNDSWLRLKHLYGVFQQQRALRSNAATLKLHDISPWLTRIQNKYVIMPGDQYVYISSADSSVHILPTKTRPKKLSFLGDNGLRYTFLFKGLEDLHLDERIMQFLSIANSMMTRQGEHNAIGGGSNLRALYYSVVPLGRQSGIIRWVDGMTPLFSIYKRWQQRDAVLKQQQKERQESGAQPQISTTTAAGTRPSELFYGKLTPLLAEHKLKISDPRKQWPLSVLRRVLKELTNDTPRDLLSKELWCSAFNASKWREIVRNFSASAAVMSVIGYIIGLGDRHLDNMLIRLSSGELLHIDYNVCFEKGKTLRVPERVPFRMTPNFEEALGLTGIEGTFRLTCEHVLRTLRKERETLLTLLEAFVYDPLVDWTLNDEGAAAAVRITSAHVAIAHMEKYPNSASNTNVGATSASGKVGPNPVGNGGWLTQNIRERFTKIRPNWLKHKNEIESELLKIATSLAKHIQRLKLIEQEESQYDSLNKQLAMVHELETLDSAITSHSLNTASERYVLSNRDAQAFQEIKNNVQVKHDKVRDQLSLINSDRIELVELQHSLLTLQCDVVTTSKLRELLQWYDDIEVPRKELTRCVELLVEHEEIRKYIPRSRQKERNLLIQLDCWYRNLLDGEIDAAVLRIQILDWLEQLNNKLRMEKNAALIYASALENVLMAISKRETAINLYLHESRPDVLTLDVATEKLQTILQNKMSSSAITSVQYIMLQTIENRNKRFIKVDLTTLQDQLLQFQLDHIKYVMTICQFIPQLPVPLNSELFTPINLLNSTLQALCTLRDSFLLSFIERIVKLFMCDDRNDLQLLMQIMCKDNMRSQELLNAVACKTICHENNDFYCLLQDIVKMFSDFEENLVQLLIAARTLFNQQQHQLPDNLKQLESKIFNENPRITIRKWKCDITTQVFDTAYRFVNAMNSHNAQIIYDVSSIYSPVLKFVYDVENAHLAGLTSLFTSIIHSNLKLMLASQSPKIRDQDLGIVKIVWEDFVESLGRDSMLCLYQQERVLHTHLMHRQKNIFQAYCWINDIDSFTLNKEYSLDAIQCNHDTLCKLQNTFLNYHTTLEHIVAQQTTQFELLNEEVARNRSYMNICQRAREHSEALICCKQMEKNEIITLLEQWKLCYDNLKLSASLITPIEKGLVQLLDPEGHIDVCWIRNATGLLDEIIYAKQRTLSALAQESKDMYDQLNTCTHQLQTLNESCEQCVCEVFKVMLKPRYNVNKCVSALYRKDKHYHSELAKIQIQLKCFARNSTAMAFAQLHDDIEKLHKIVIQNRQEMREFMDSVINGELQLLPAQEAHSESSSDNENSEHLEKKTSCNQNEQKRNVYAVSVWKRIRMKLEGRDPNTKSRSAVTEQVDFIIREAMNLDNLAVLYEGWTPWV